MSEPEGGVREGLGPIRGALRNLLRRVLKQLPTHDELDRAGTVKDRLRVTCGGDTTLLAIASNPRGLSFLAFAADADGQLPPEPTLRWYLLVQGGGLPLGVIAQDDVRASLDGPDQTRQIMFRTVGQIIPEARVTDASAQEPLDDGSSSFVFPKRFNDGSSASEWKPSDIGSGTTHGVRKAVEDLADFLKRGGKLS